MKMLFHYIIYFNVIFRATASTINVIKLLHLKNVLRFCFSLSQVLIGQLIVIVLRHIGFAIDRQWLLTVTANNIVIDFNQFSND